MFSSPGDRLRANIITIFTLALLMVFVFSLSSLAENDYTPEEAENDLREIEVDMHNFYFEPDEIAVEPGEEVKFIVDNPSSAFHTFTIYQSRTEREEPVVDLALSAGQEKTVTVEMPEEEKELYLVCLPHEGVEMIGSIIVGEISE